MKNFFFDFRGLLTTARRAQELRAARQARAARIRRERQWGAQQEAQLRQEALRQALHLPSLAAALRRAMPRVTAVVAVVSVIGNIFLYSRFSPHRPLVTVGPRVVQRGEYMADLDNAAGKAVLSQIVFSALILQAAAKAHVMPSAQDVNTALAGLRRQSPTGTAPDAALRDRVRMALALENLRLRGITASNAEIAAYYAQHQSQFAAPAHADATVVVTGTAATAARAAALLDAGRTEAQIAAVPGMHVGGVNGFQLHLGALPPAVRSAVEEVAMSLVGKAVQTLHVAPGTYYTLQVHRQEPGVALPLAQVRGQVARLVRLQKAPSERDELIALYHAAPPSFDMTRYAGYFSSIAEASVPPNTIPPAQARTASVPPAGGLPTDTP